MEHPENKEINDHICLAPVDKISNIIQYQTHYIMVSHTFDP